MIYITAEAKEKHFRYVSVIVTSWKIGWILFAAAFASLCKGILGIALSSVI